MTGTTEGGRKAAAANLAKDPAFYKKIGAKGGSRSTTGGFSYLADIHPERHRKLSAKGGRISKRKPRT